MPSEVVVRGTARFFRPEAQAVIRRRLAELYETRLERPKLYDHYALLLVTLIRRNRELEARVAALEARDA